MLDRYVGRVLAGNALACLRARIQRRVSQGLRYAAFQAVQMSPPAPTLNADIRAWIDSWNEQVRPYIWAKAADQILDSIARSCARINDSRRQRAVLRAAAVMFQPGR
jgi:hypothetical protein